MKPRVLFRIGWRYLTRHPWQTILMVVGITLGVAVAVAIDLANASASRAFDLSTDSVAGRATHTLTGGPSGLDEVLFTSLERSGIDAAAAPILTEYVSSPQLGGQLLQLLGIDPFSEAPFRDYLGSAPQQSAAQPGKPSGASASELISFLTQPGAVFISTDLARRYGLRSGDGIILQIDGRSRQAFIAGLIQPADSLSKQALDTLLLADIATLQELTGRLGRLDRIDLILPDSSSPAGEQVIQTIRGLIPEGVYLQPVDARTGSIEQMTSAFRVNLTALSLLALVVGLFLIYNTMTFSVIQRRPLFGTLRSLGVTREEAFLMVIVEAFIIGILGSIFGILFGVILGQGAVKAVSRTINDLFFVVNVQSIQIPISSLLRGGILGITATVLTAAPPAWEAASVTPNLAMSRSGLETRARSAVWLAAGAGGAFFVIGMGILWIPTHNLVISFGGTFFVLVGFALLAPAVTVLMARLSMPLLGRIWGALGRMAPREVIGSLSRTSVAVAALMVAVSVAIGVSLMVSSFRHTVILWLDQVLQGDIYISAPTTTATQTSAPIDPAVIADLEKWPGVDQVFMLRSVTVDSLQGPAHINASSNPRVSLERLYLSTDGPISSLPEKLQSGAVIVTEPYANRHNIPGKGGLVTLFTDQGPHDFPVAGIFYDYASTQGTILMNLKVYRQYWNDPQVTSLSLHLAPGAEIENLVNQLRTGLSASQQLVIRPNQVLRSEVLQIFDRTFAITGALQVLATLVAFIGVLSALLSLELDRQREYGILRAIGLTARQLWGLIMIETGMLGAVAGILAMPTGYVLAVILIYIINRRSFGWTLQMQVLPLPFLQAFAVSLFAALLAGIYPAYRIGKMITAEAMRYE